MLKNRSVDHRLQFLLLLWIRQFKLKALILIIHHIRIELFIKIPVN